MATLKDVARDAGVSVATVSCCLSGSKPVKESTRMKILDSVERLKYIPNASARNLKSPRSRLIGVVLTDIDNLYHAEIFKGISSSLQSQGYTVSVAFSNNQPDQECEIINDFISQNVAGLLIITCQPQNTDFFQSRILNFHIPVVFLERIPWDLDVCLAGFQNEEITFYLTDALLKKGYRQIGLVLGPLSFSSEQDCMLGYQRAFSKNGLSPTPSLICTTNLTKEDAFKTVLTTLSKRPLEAVISSSETLHWGALEALKNRGFSIPGQVLLLTFGEETWSQAHRTEGVIYTSRTAFHLGSCASRLLLKHILYPDCTEKTLILSDSILKEPLEIPPIDNPFRKLLKAEFSPELQAQLFQEISSMTGPLFSSCPLTTDTQLRILLADLSTAHSVELLSDSFTRSTGIRLSFQYLPQKELLPYITHHSEEPRAFDICMYDIPWLDYLVQNSLLADLTEFITGEDFHPESIFPENMENCRCQDGYYGIPLIGGAQILFYRRDLFEDSRCQKLFYKLHGSTLKPPRTWTEFNRIASFFTQSENPHSPTPFGTSLAGVTDEELAPELWIRLWAMNGRLWDAYNRPCLDCPENQAALESVLETLRYTGSDPFSTSIPQTVENFSLGRTAMLITYTEYATQISRSLHENIIGQVGYKLLPGRRPASIGWNLGVNPYSSKAPLAFQFFRWLCQRDTSFYITILDGQSPVMAPYHSLELLKLYPWMSITEESFSYTQKRKGPYKHNALVVPQNKIEGILCQTLRQVLQEGTPISQALADNQERLRSLLLSYGYPRPFTR
ncbi:MAG: extracellular solute-binding protein [Lachnospiraceae bacterium]|nr:extracellular solute-binding protein [Lachnospiraceae bacterium]